MQVRNTHDRYGAIAQLLHWGVVALVVTQFILAELAENEPELSLARFAMVTRHKWMGMTILMLLVLRLVWRWANPVPALPQDVPRWQAIASRISHVSLYLLLLAQPLTGWMMSSAKSLSVTWFGLVTFPDLVAPSEATFEVMHEVHEMLATLLIIVVTIHVAAALKHHFIDRDDVLRRMLPVALRRHGTHQVLAATTILAMLCTPQPVLAATDWAVDRERSRLGFVGEQAGAEFEGVFRDFKADIRFDPADLEASRFDVRIATGSVDTGDSERDQLIRGPDLFAAREHPTAHYVAERFEQTGEGYVARGALTLRGRTRAVPVRFRFLRDQGEARLVGTATLERLAFGVGRGDWQDTEWVANEVTVEFSLVLERTQPSR